MSTIAFIYPGQGAQRPGMGQSLVEEYAEARAAFQLASETLGIDMKALCFHTSALELANTENAQRVLFTVSMAIHWILEAAGIIPVAVAGFSLGECVALCAAGYLNWEDGLRLVDVRSRAMKKSAEVHPGAMAAIVGLSWERIEALCAGEEGFVQPVNDNAPGQVVVAGNPKAIDNLSNRVMEIDGTRVVPLAVSAAFHTSLMAEAGMLLEEYMQRSLVVNPGKIRLYSNLNGMPLPNEINLPKHVSTHMQKPVLWQSCIHAMRNDGIDTFLEVGEGKTLCNLIRRIDCTALCFATGNRESIEKSISIVR